MTKIFLSYSKPQNKQQNIVIKYIKKYLQKEGFNLIEVKSENYYVSPIYIINNAIKECDYFLCIVYEKEKIILKNGSALYFTSPWLDIEIALAISHSLPFFIIKEEKLIKTALLNSTDSLPYCSLPNTLNNTIDTNYLKYIIMPQIINSIHSAIY